MLVAERNTITEMLSIHDNVDNVLIPVPNAPKFKEILGGIGWLNTQEQDHYAYNWLVVIGEAEDNSYTVISESFGSINVIAKESVNAKDRFLLSRIYADDTETENIKHLRQYDGLAAYHIYGKDGMGSIRFVRKPRDWEYFRDRDTVCSIAAVSPDIRENLPFGIELLKQLRSEGRLILRPECPRCDWVIRQRPPYVDVIKHPLAHALIYVLATLERNKRNIFAKPLKRTLYTNRDR